MANDVFVVKPTYGEPEAMLIKVELTKDAVGATRIVVCKGILSLLPLSEEPTVPERNQG